MVSKAAHDVPETPEDGAKMGQDTSKRIPRRPKSFFQRIPSKARAPKSTIFFVCSVFFGDFRVFSFLSSRRPPTGEEACQIDQNCSRSFQDGGIPAHECVCGVVGSEWAGPKNTQMLLRSVFQDLSGGSETQCSIVLISLLHVAQREGHLPNDDDDDAA